MSRAPLRCVVVTPEETVLDMEAEFIALPLYDGELGVAPGHAPMIGRLGYGELRIRTAGETRRIYVDGGFVQVADNVASVLTNRAIASTRLKVSDIEKTVVDLQQRRAVGEEEISARQRAVQQARAQLRVARRTS
ncbi:MAG: ATP synthase F1 subunit epsilon [Planctomycetales bacterium]|nr:ATP synthase F1 subunit epsilon [Planctomycetales bacterium]